MKQLYVDTKELQLMMHECSKNTNLSNYNTLALLLASINFSATARCPSIEPKGLLIRHSMPYLNAPLDAYTTVDESTMYQYEFY